MSDPNSQWTTQALATTYLEGVRGAIPLADAQIEILLHIVQAWVCQVRRPEQQERLRVLDLGCGDGILGRSVLDRCPGADVVFVDFSAPMLDAARAKLGTSSAARIVQTDFSSPDWLSSLADKGLADKGLADKGLADKGLADKGLADKGLADKGPVREGFDVVLSGFSIHHQVDERKRALYAEIYGLLDRGGVFLNLEHVASPTPAVETLFNEYFIDRLYAHHRRSDSSVSRQGVAETYYSRPDKVENKLASVEAQCEWLRESGFVDVDCFFKVFELALFGGRKPHV